MDDSVKRELKELEAKCFIIKTELAAARSKLQDRKREVLSAVLYYEEMEKRLTALYDDDKKVHDKLLRFKLRNGLLRVCPTQLISSSLACMRSYSALISLNSIGASSAESIL